MPTSENQNGRFCHFGGVLPKKREVDDEKGGEKHETRNINRYIDVNKKLYIFSIKKCETERLV